jgi:polyisoprenoid-binding protein YceI
MLVDTRPNAHALPLALTLGAFALLASATAAASEYAIDPSHSSAGFSVKHMMVSTVRGQFSNVNGTIHYDPANVAATTVEATIDATTVDTREPKRDAHLKSPDFFDVEKFKTLTFKSTSASRNADGTLAITGDLTIHGVTRSVVLTVDGPSAPVKDPYGNLKVGATATTKISRHDFGLNWNKALEAGGVLVGDDVSITLDIEAKQTK